MAGCQCLKISYLDLVSHLVDLLVQIVHFYPSNQAHRYRQDHVDHLVLNLVRLHLIQVYLLEHRHVVTRSVSLHRFYLLEHRHVVTRSVSLHRLDHLGSLDQFQVFFGKDRCSNFQLMVEMQSYQLTVLVVEQNLQLC